MLQLMTHPAAAAATADEPRRAVDEAAAPSDASFVLEALVAADQPPLPALDAAALAALPVAPAAVQPLPGESAAEVQIGEVEALLGSLLAQSQVQVQARAEQARAAPQLLQPAQAALAVLPQLALAQVGGRQSPVTAHPQPATADDAAPAAAGDSAQDASAARPQPAMPDSALRQLAALAPAGDGKSEVQVPLTEALLAELPGGDSAAVGAARPALEAALRGEPNGPLSRPAALEQRLQLQGPEAKWGEQMLHALRDSVELQLKQNKQQAIIRLDPAELGSLEIRLNQEGGRLQVQISAAQGDVARLLQQTSDRLRQDLIGQHFVQVVQVDVQVAADSQSGQRHARQAPDPFAEGAPRAAREEQADVGRAGQPVRSDVLVSV